jgi:hexokinase
MQNTKYDEAVDSNSINPGFQMFEKRVSGMFLGEVLRQVLLTLIKEANLFSGNSSHPLETQYGIDTSAMSTIAADNTDDLTNVGETIAKAFEIAESSLDDRKAVKLVSDAIARRSARLAAVAVSAVSDHTGRFDNATATRPVDVGADGSLVEFYPHYVDMCLAACEEILGNDASTKIRIGLAKDGSGVGAALYHPLPLQSNNRCALQAKKQEEDGVTWDDSTNPQ